MTSVCGVRVARSLSFLYSVLHIIVCPFHLFLFAIVLSVFLPLTASDYPFGVVNVFSPKM
jgi:hypothetical protein